MGVLQSLDQLNIIEDCLRLGLLEQLKDIELTLIDSFVELAHLHNILIPLYLHLFSLMFHHHRKQLLLQAIERHSKVDDIDPDKDLWQKVRIGDLGKEVQSEVLIVVNVLFTEFDHRHIIDCLDLLGEDRVQNCRQSILNVHQQHRNTVFN